MSTLTELLERVEKAEGPDREIDARLWQIVCPDTEVLFDPGDVRTRRPAQFGRLADFPLNSGWEDWAGIAGHVGAPLVTASVDAALALVERVLPGCNRQMVDGEPNRNPWVKLSPLWEGGRRPVDGIGATLPLAIVSALLRALIAKAAP